jgi:hypothetical protein
MNSEQEITVSTIVSEEYWGEIYEEDEEESKIWDVTVGDGLEEDSVGFSNEDMGETKSE